MKLTTKEWITSAEDDLLSAKKLAEEIRLTNIVAFHCQQCIEKSFKALIEEQLGISVKSHDLIRLKDKANLILPDDDITTLAIINEVYIDARYPGDMGLMQHGKPTPGETKKFILFSQSVLEKVINLMG